MVVLIVWVSIGYGSILVLEFFGVDDLRDAEGAASGTGTYVYWLAVPVIVVGGSVLLLLVMAVGAIFSRRIRNWWTSSEPSPAAPSSSSPPYEMSLSLHQFLEFERRRAGAASGGDDRDDASAGDDDVDDPFAEPAEEFDVCSYCGSLVQVLRGRLECLQCGARFR